MNPTLAAVGQTVVFDTPYLVKVLTVAFGLGVLGMFGLILWIQIQTSARRRHIETLRLIWRKPILSFLAEENFTEPHRSLIEGAKKEPLRFLQLLMNFGNLLQGRTNDNLVRLITATPLLHWMRQVSQRKSDYRFPEIARATALFKLMELREGMLKHINSRRTVDQVPAAYAIARLAHLDDLKPVAAAIHDLAVEKRDLAFIILAAYAEERPDKFLEFIQENIQTGGPVQLLSIEVAGSLNLGDTGPVLLEVLKQAKTPDVLAAALLASGRIRLVEAHEAFHVHIHSPDDKVRGAATWALGRLRDPGDADSLASLLEDTSWAVRLNAASGLVELDAAGVEALRRVVNTTNDRYARDMAQRALTHRELGVPVA